MRRSVATAPLSLGVLFLYALSGCGGELDGNVREAISTSAAPLQDEYLVWTDDAASNSRSWALIECGLNEVMVGIAYKDLPGSNSDVMDGLTPWCASPGGQARRVLNPDIEANPSSLVDVLCALNNVVVGIAYKDLPNSDFADGVTILCAPAGTPGGTPESTVIEDLSANPRASETLRCLPSERPVGIAYKDTPQEWGDSDYADAVTVECK